MANKQYLNFIGTVWDLLPLEDKDRLAETWTGYEQVFASVYQKVVENDLNVSINTLQSYSTERWLDYSFLPEEKIARPPIYTSTQDLSVGLNLTSRYLVRFSIDGGTPFEVDLRGLFPVKTTIDEVVVKINEAAGFRFARTIFENSIVQLVSVTPAPLGSITILPASDPEADATEYILGIEAKNLPQKFPRFPHSYPLPHERIVSIPTLQTKIRDESAGIKTLKEGEDYALEANRVISFLTEPQKLLWAKKTQFDQETPWHNFGFLMDIYQKNTPQYLQVIQGLWYAFWTGPKPRNLRIALYLLFGLPVTPDDSVVTAVSPEAVEVTLTKDGTRLVFPVPAELVPIVALGQRLDKYDPLVNGIEIFDKISRPGFIEEDIGRVGIQRFLLPEATRGTGDTDETKALRLLEEHTFLPQISVEAFVSPNINLGNVQTFLGNIKPLSKAFLFQVIVGNFKDNMKFGDRISYDFSIDVTPNLDSNQTTFAEASLLDAHELDADSAMALDTDGVCMQEGIEIEVYSAGLLIDSFIA